MKDYTAGTVCLFNGNRVAIATGKVIYRLSSIKGNPNAGPHVWVTNMQGQRLLAKVTSLQPC